MWNASRLALLQKSRAELRVYGTLLFFSSLCAWTLTPCLRKATVSGITAPAAHSPKHGVKLYMLRFRAQQLCTVPRHIHTQSFHPLACPFLLHARPILLHAHAPAKSLRVRESLLCSFLFAILFISLPRLPRLPRPHRPHYRPRSRPSCLILGAGARRSIRSWRVYCAQRRLFARVVP